jgi:hypothetical protein
MLIDKITTQEILFNKAISSQDLCPDVKIISSLHGENNILSVAGESVELPSSDVIGS